MSEWRTMETAPTDGSPVLVFGFWAGEINGVEDTEPQIMIAGFCGDQTDYRGFNWSVAGGDAYASWVKPTHWMPLPEKPVRP